MCRLMTPRLEEVLKGYPLYSQDGRGKEAVCVAIFAFGAIRWFILEGEVQDSDTILYGIVVGPAEDEYGYISLNELSEVTLDLGTRLGQVAGKAAGKLPAYKYRTTACSGFLKDLGIEHL